MYQTCRISWQEVTRSDKYSVLSYVVFSFSSALIARSLRARHHISGKTTFRTLCAGAHKVRESRPPGSVRGVLGNGHSYRDRPSKDYSTKRKRSRIRLQLVVTRRLVLETRCFGVEV